jgi:YebC/PmpR family DNA-binding regulatory protein
VAGHNKWSKIKHRKAVVDKRRGKVWTKVAKAMMVAARHGGPDPAFNLALRYAIDEARYANMPRDVIERAIKKGAGGEDTSQYETVRYEGYAPGGIAVVVDALTDNRTRTAGDVRNAFAKAGGNLGTSGCVSFMFAQKGRILVKPEGVDPDRLFALAADAGADDVIEPPPADDDADRDPWTVLTDIPGYLKVKDALESAGFTIDEASLAMIPADRVAVPPEHAEALADLIDELDELDDVQKVSTNAM